MSGRMVSVSDRGDGKWKPWLARWLAQWLTD